MATRIRTVDFLPEIFRTPTNRQFLGATLDQLVQDPKLKPTQGYIGRRNGPGVNPNDSYVLAPTKERTYYQLEPGVVTLEPNTNNVVNALTYPGLIDSLSVKGGNTTRQDRLFSSEYYSWDPLVDLDKFVNFSQYYWLPNGPDSVDVSAADVPIVDQFTVTRNSSDYTFSGVPGTNPTITLVRQGSYTFDVQQTGSKFWIQAVPGTSGVLPQTPNQSSRDVLGVINNGDDNGTITFNVPAKSAQNFYYQLADSGNVDFATGLQFDQINNIYYEEFVQQYGGIDGITDIDGRTIIFLNDAGWFYTGLFDSPGQPFDIAPFDETLEITEDSQKYSVWRITLVYDDPNNPYIKLTTDRLINPLSKLVVKYGNEYSNISFYKTAEGSYERIPLLTANLDYLYYQDANNPELFGVIKLVDSSGEQTIDIDEIIGQKNYTSPNGVVFTNGLKVQFQGVTNPASYQSNEYYVEGVGTAITLTKTSLLITPETYTRSNTTPYDSTPFDATAFDDTLNAPLDPDYMTMNRSSKDYNAWSRSNRWFHIDVINATAKYNGVDPVINNELRAKRPIIEFRPGLRLFEVGTEGLEPINIIDFSATDALSDINGTIGYSINGYSFVNGTRVIFANDRDPEVRNKIFEVSFITPEGSGQPVIDLQPADLDKPDILINQNVVCLSGITLQGVNFYYDGNSWVAGQQKTQVNQPPLFDIYDSNGFSFSDTTVYPGSSFKGTKLFSYAIGSGTTDPIVEQPLKYLTIDNVGDILFDNNLYTDTFVYVRDTVSVEKAVHDGLARQYLTRTDFKKLNGWQAAASTTVSRQEFQFTYKIGQSLVVDVPVTTTGTAIPVKVFVESEFVNPTEYTYEVKSDNSTVITFVNEPADGAIVQVSVISAVASPVGFYSVPTNLENNPLNNEVTQLTLGTIRNYYGSICQNLVEFDGLINGANNTRDLGNIIPYGDEIIQNSGSLVLPSLLINNKEFDFLRALEYSSTEYQKFKNLLLDTVARTDFQNMSAGEILDECIKIINLGKTELSPFYWTDMIPFGSTYQETNYTVSPITSNTFDTLYSYDFDNANYRGILVYLNNQLLIADGHEYTVATDGPRVTILVPLQNGDIVSIREYETTFGSFVPSTPTKLGLYPAYIPEKYLDTSYTTPTDVIRGHDGSITVAFNDIRDDILLEFEKRVYDNLKVESNEIPLHYEDVAPGQFRTTDYTQQEITSILSVSFLSWVGANKLDYRLQDYSATNKFTWNYTSSQNKLSKNTLLGNWRGIYNYFYDTDAPDTRPWECLGFSEKPSWWEDEYGPAPYTSGNLVLWDDLENGLVRDPAGSYVIEKFKRPGLTKVIPTDSEGNLIPPFDVMVGSYDQNRFKKSWVVGDEGPVEAAWRKSSAWPFAVQRLLVLTKPAQYFTYFVDRDRLRYNTELLQFVFDNRYRDPENVTIDVYGNGIIKHSYLNYIIDYNKLTGYDSQQDLQSAIRSVDVRLCYRMGGFSDKQYLKIYTEKSSPNSLNTSLLLPDESYQLLLYKNPTIDTLTWSSVIVQRTETGYSVYGYSTTQPYFEILTSVPNGSYQTITVGNQSVRAILDHSDTVVRVPYGYEFTTVTSVVDFLVSYGAFMERKGMTFEDKENNKILNWTQMAQEFMYWSQQGWATGSLINLNPAANVLRINKPNMVAEPLNTSVIDDVMLNQNKQPLQSRDYVVERFENELVLRGVNNQVFSYLNAKFTAYEHLIVFDNKSIFNDLIYNPTSGARQSRLLLTGYTTYDWNGSLDAQGFILNQDNIESWSPNRSYSKGQIVKYKDAYWSAAKIIPPTDKFDFSVWIKSDYDKIQKGLLPNAATRAEQSRNFYDINSANLERDADLLGFGLIGFRPRRYMQNLNLDDISQVNLYSQFLDTKGTTQATDIFKQANLGKEVAEYDIFENWAIQRALYGANANRSYFELRLNQALLLANPSTVQVIEPQQASTADQTIQVNDIWKESYKITSPKILPTTVLNASDVALPTAGYVNWDDADIKVFDLNNLTEIINNLPEVLVGSSIWVAKDNSYSWNIYRNNLVTFAVKSVKDNLNGKSTITFANKHGLKVGQRIVIKYFDSAVDGAYEIVSVPSLKTITVNLSLTGLATEIEGTGICFVLESMRVAQASDVSNLSYSSSLVAGNKAWVDDDGTGHWAVYEKIDPFTVTGSLEPDTPSANSKFGSAIALGFTNNNAALVGVPNYNDGVGLVYTFAKSDSGEFVQTGRLEMSAPNFVGYGSSMDAGSSYYAIVGAPQSWANQGYSTVVYRSPDTGSYLQTQLLTQVPYRLYSVTADGSTTAFDPSASFTITDINKVGIVVDDVVQEYGADWTYSAPNIVFDTAPADGANVSIFLYDQLGQGVTISDDERWLYLGAPGGNRVYAYNQVKIQTQVKNFKADGGTASFDISDTIVVDSNAVIGGTQIGVTVNDLPKTLNVDFTFNGTSVVFDVAPNNNDEVRVIRKQSAQYFATSAGSFVIGTKYKISTVGTTDFTAIGAASNTPGLEFIATGVGSGNGSAVEVPVLTNLHTATTISSFSVVINDVLQRPDMDYTFNETTKELTILNNNPITSILVTSDSYYQFVSYFDVDGIDDNAKFGQSLASTTDGRQIIIGAPGDTVNGEVRAGAVYMFDRCVERFTVTDATQKTYQTLRSFNGAPTVKVNATFLIPSDGANNNGQFTNDGVDTVTLDVTLNIGDTIEIETNDFAFVERLVSQNPTTNYGFGTVVDQCPTNCSLYIGQPNDSTNVPEGGSVERFVNQSRLYGTITGFDGVTPLSAPVLTPGDSIRINNFEVPVPSYLSWNSGIEWSNNTFVEYGGDLYRSLQPVPVGVSISNTEYWEESSWSAAYVVAINAAAIPNVSAYLDNGCITIDIDDHDATVPFTQLFVLPGLGSAFVDLGFDPMHYTQTIIAPEPSAFGHFGASLNISDDSYTLVVGSPQGSAAQATTFDGDMTIFDSKATNFFDLKAESGIVYTYDLLLSANPSIHNPSKFVFGRQIYDEQLTSLDAFGTAVAYKSGILLIGSPQNDLGDSVGDYGRVAQLTNVNKEKAWKIVYRQQPIVDVNLINSVFSYDKVSSNVTQYFDFIDPLQGKILGSARQNISYIGATDPAAYNTGPINNYGDQWLDDHLGQVWWDLSTTRFIDYHQSTIQYASRRWGQLFPGSTVDIYEWIVSDVPPAQYAGPGQVYNTTSYVLSSKLTPDGLFATRYFYWVKGLNVLPPDSGNNRRTLSVSAIAQYIEHPKSSGIPYIAALAEGTVALYNAKDLISAQDTILHIEFDKIANTDNVHVEYDLIASRNPDSFLGAGLYRKMLDSFCGEDTLGNKVPDINLSPADLYGVNFRPRQSFFVDRFLALENYLKRANTILAQYTISDSRTFNLLNSSEPQPTSVSGEYNKLVANYIELTFQDLGEVPVGYKYLVNSDETVDGLWTIYTVQADKTLLLSRVQNYDTRQYWTYTDWIKPGYNAGVKPVAEVPTYSELALLNVQEGASAKVTRNSYGKYEVYQYVGGSWDRVILQDGTIEIKEEVWNYSAGRFGFDVETFDAQRFDEAPSIETRQIIKALNEEIFVSDLAIYRNELLLLVFEYILTEQEAPDWLFKTSLIDINHKIRDLLPYQIYRKDNQDFVIDYLKEVKPYHVKIKEFNLRYDGLDAYDGAMTDFDCPPYYDASLNEFIGPILDDGEVPIDPDSSKTSNDLIWKKFPWSEWYTHYKLLLQDVDVLDGGFGYTLPPIVTVIGDAERPAEVVAKVNTAGNVTAIVILDPGSGYTTTPTIVIEGGNGRGAIAVPVMGNDLVRSITTTIKYDRVEYTSSVVIWEPNTKYAEGSLVRYNNNVWSVNNVADSAELDSGSEFDPQYYTLVDESTLSGTDRTYGLYTPTANEPGNELALVINGIDYPGVQVKGPSFNQNTGFDVGNFDVNPFDNIDYGPEGLPTYDPSILNAIYESAFIDTYLGTRPTDINVDGGQFIDTYSSHAPEELVPGSVFDTLDMRVYTRPGSDWTGDGHGFDLKSVNAIYDLGMQIDFGNMIRDISTVAIFNVTTKTVLLLGIDYTVNWATKTASVTSGASVGDILELTAYGIGGGSQLFKETYPGNKVGNNLVIPVMFSEIEELLVIANGEVITNYTYYAVVGGSTTVIEFDDTYTINDSLVITAFGLTTPTQKSWSIPLTEYFTSDGSTTVYELSNSLQGTNKINLMVTVDGLRLRPAESVKYVASGTGPYYLPTRGNVAQGLISDNDVVVYVNGVLQSLSVNYTVSPWDGSSDRYVEFNTAPASGAEVIIALTTYADYIIDNGNDLSLRSVFPAGATIAVTTWNDTQEQGLLTQVFVGPTETGVTVQQPFDSTDFDSATVVDTPGSFDYAEGTQQLSNRFDTGRILTNGERLFVSMNGYTLLLGNGYTVDGSNVILSGEIISQSDVVVITSMTQAVVPEAEAFRIFQDMLGNQKIYRLTDMDTTILTAELSETDDIIHVADVTHLATPDIEANIFGVLVVNGERITYRNKDVLTNTVSGLRRGVAGTAIDTHSVNSVVTDIGRGEQLPAQYQKTIEGKSFYATGLNDKIFTVDDVNLDVGDEDAVRVKVGGFDLLPSAYSITGYTPLQIELVTAPVQGEQVDVYVVRAHVMYEQGLDTASNGIPLQEQQTEAAKFIRGDV